MGDGKNSGSGGKLPGTNREYRAQSLRKMECNGFWTSVEAEAILCRPEISNYHFWLYRVWQHLACSPLIWLGDFPVRLSSASVWHWNCPGYPSRSKRCVGKPRLSPLSQSNSGQEDCVLACPGFPMSLPVWAWSGAVSCGVVWCGVVSWCGILCGVVCSVRCLYSVCGRVISLRILHGVLDFRMLSDQHAGEASICCVRWSNEAAPEHADTRSDHLTKHTCADGPMVRDCCTFNRYVSGIRRSYW